MSLQAIRTPRAARTLGLTISGIAVAFLVLDGTMKILALPVVMEANAQLGYAADTGLIRTLGAILLACTALYAMPRTAILGAVLLTGFLGGAVASHVRIASPLFTHVLFGVYVGLMVWGGLYLRDPRLRCLLPLRELATGG
jgi:DoxX-like protein